MPACESKLVSRSSRKATVVKTVFVDVGPGLTAVCLASLVGHVLRVLGWVLTRIRNSF